MIFFAEFTIEESMGYFQHFLRLLETEELPGRKRFRNRQFCQYLIDKHGFTNEIVAELAPILTESVCKPQMLIEDHEDSYVAVDMRTNTLYMCSRDLLMADVDLKDDETVDDALERAQQFCNERPTALLRVFRTRKGLHIFRVDAACPHTTDTAIKDLICLGGDPYHIIYSKIRGFSVRLNRKENDVDPLYTELDTIGTGKADDCLSELVDLHLILVDHYADFGESLMK